MEDPCKDPCNFELVVLLFSHVAPPKKIATAIYAKRRFRHKPYWGYEALAQVNPSSRDVPGDVLRA